MSGSVIFASVNEETRRNEERADTACPRRNARRLCRIGEEGGWPALEGSCRDIDGGSHAVDAGNDLFAQGQWEQAKAQYEAAIKVQPTLAETHYDLALTLDRLGNKQDATAHYKEAANLAPATR